MKNTYLYFRVGKPTEAIVNQTGQVITITTGSGDPIPPAQAGKGANTMISQLFTVGVDVVTEGMTFGSAYGSPATGTQVDLNSDAFLYGGTGAGELTIPTAAADAVNGFTDSTTTSENDYTITVDKPIVANAGVLYPASNLRGIQVKDANETYLYFDALTGDANDVDTILLAHTSGAHKLLAENLNNAIQRPENQGKVIQFANIAQGVYFDGNPAGISACTITVDS